jgi:hypothetical protein
MATLRFDRESRAITCSEKSNILAGGLISARLEIEILSRAS